MIDVHIIVSHDTRPEWLAQCLGSVRIAADLADFPVVIHQVPGVPGHIGKARASGYSLGSHPYVTCVDDDDYVLPNVFTQMESAIHRGVSAVCTPEWIDRNGWDRREKGRARHHLIAYRRDVLIDHTQWVCCGDIAQISVIPDDAIDLQERTYVHRIYPDSRARVLRRVNQQELERSRG